MQREDYITQFQTECYLPAATAAMNRFMVSYTDHAEEIHKTVVGQFDAFFRCIRSQAGTGDFFGSMDFSGLE